jgi:type IV pilus assembly protein PilA
VINRLRKRAQEEREGGFTLIELLVVMIIIGILAAIAIPLFLSQRQKGYDASVKSDLHTLANELESYYTDQQAYPYAASASTNLGPTSAVIGTDTVRLSPNNLFKITMNAADNAYCIEGATFPAGTATWAATGFSSTRQWFYISSQGGLQPSTTTSCGTF